MTMTHPGLPEVWVYTILVCMGLLFTWGMLAPVVEKRSPSFNLSKIPLFGALILWANRGPWFLLAFKVVILAIFLLVVVAGIYGTPIAERNLATALTWNLWWAGLIVIIFFLGSAWCAVCPWDTLANWLVKRRLWKRAGPTASLNLTVPKWMRNVIPALLMFIGLTWLELGVGVTTNPYATALLAVLMVVLATISLAVFEKKAFCRYFCPVGRTIGFYSQLAPVELRPIDPDTCANCTTLECYHGTDNIDPCPTQLVMGTLKQNTYCTSCGNCSQSCPHQNITWRLRSVATEVVQMARPHWDEAWFMLGLMALTTFHGITMMPFWESWMTDFAQVIGDSGQLLSSFSLGLVISMVIPMAFYGACIGLSHLLLPASKSYWHTFYSLAFVTIPLAFAYHLAHNLNHLIRETVGMLDLFLNPLGTDALPLSMMEKHQRHFQSIISEETLHILQTGLMVLGFLIAIRVIRRRGLPLLGGVYAARWRIMPIYGFAIGITLLHVWLLAQPMVMRM
ncbi:MAG: 4Fe-4S binding protein [Methylococcales bacterium]|jgi:polyferredoxin|nr:4Fe-4S binding protein [Methylococcales bacterium]